MGTPDVRGTMSGPEPVIRQLRRWAFVWWTLLHLGARLASAGETRFAVDRAEDLGELARTGRLAVAVERAGDVYRLDASAVLRVDAQRLLRVSMDYERYAQIGVPNLRASHVVSSAQDGDAFHTWSWMSCFGYASKHYLAVHVVRNLASGAAGIRWELTPRQRGWAYEDAPAFVRLDGSWYIEPLAEGVVYVRYYVVVALDPSVPEVLRAWAVKRHLRDGTHGVVHALAQEAGWRP